MSCAESSTDDSVADTHSSHDDTKSDTTSNTQNDWQSNASGDNLLRTPQSNYPDKQSAETADRDASVIQVSPISNTLLFGVYRWCSASFSTIIPLTSFTEFESNALSDRCESHANEVQQSRYARRERIIDGYTMFC